MSENQLDGAPSAAADPGGVPAATTLAALSRTPPPVFGREDVLRRLGRSVADREPIVGAGSSCGLVAKAAEAGGADLIIVYSTGISRLRGLPTTVFGNPNDMTLTMADEILNVVEDTPVICGVEAADPNYVRLPRLLAKVEEAGYSGIINFPTVTLFEPGSSQREQRESLDFGFGRELELVALARERGLFTMSYVFQEQEAASMVDAGVDCIVVHVGATRGGMEGYGAAPIDRALQRVRDVMGAARSRREDVLVLAHGGPFDVPENVAELYRSTAAQGFVGASSIERIPIEEAVAGVVRSFKANTTQALGVEEASST
jgi:predicted TIM-barrel enzyme